MTLPSITVLIPTYGRTKLLERAIASALDQSYEGAVRVIVLNDFTQQHIQCACRNPQAVTVINSTLLPSLGEKRNMLLDLCTSEWAYFLDDDDMILPWCFSSRMRDLPADVNGVCSTRNFHMVGDGLSSSGPAPMDFLFRVAAVGRFKPENCGEDQNFRSSVLGGVLARDVMPSHLYCWGNGVCHVSGINDKEDHIKRERFLNDASERVAKGEEPVGKITLIPESLRLERIAERAYEMWVCTSKPKTT